MFRFLLEANGLFQNHHLTSCCLIAGVSLVALRISKIYVRIDRILVKGFEVAKILYYKNRLIFVVERYGSYLAQISISVEGLP